MKKPLFIATILASLLIAGCIGGTQQTTTPQSGQQTTGGEQTVESLIIKGSDTELEIVSSMAEEFGNMHPDVLISVTGGGSGTGIAALINGEIDVADASRQIKDEEIQNARKMGVDPKEIIIGNDGIAVIVNENNPVAQLTLRQIGDIYKGDTTHWQAVGGPDQQVTLYGRQSTSGTYSFFRDVVVEADYSRQMRNMEGNSAIVEAVKTDETGIGYVGIGYAIDDAGNEVEGINILAVAKDASSDYAKPTEREKVVAGQYPVSRALYQYVDGKPAKGSVLHKFITYEVSDEGQAIVEDAGFFPLTTADKQANAAVLE